MEVGNDERAILCGEAITKVLKEYNCSMSVKMLLEVGKITPILDIIPLENKEELGE